MMMPPQCTSYQHTAAKLIQIVYKTQDPGVLIIEEQYALFAHNKTRIQLPFFFCRIKQYKYLLQPAPKDAEMED